MLAHTILRALAYTTDTVALAYASLRYWQARKARPPLPKADILYQEWFASGNSDANLLTRLGGASRCLRLVITRDYLVVTSYFPFIIITGLYDLDYSIPRARIVSVRTERIRLLNRVVLTFQDPQSRLHTLLLIPQDPQAFLQTLTDTQK